MKLKTRKTQYGFTETICPVCGEGNFQIRIHLSRKKDKKHKQFYLKNSKLVTKRVLNTNIY